MTTDTTLDLDAIEARHAFIEKAVDEGNYIIDSSNAAIVKTVRLMGDVPDLIAEIRKLRAELARRDQWTNDKPPAERAGR